MRKLTDPTPRVAWTRVLLGHRKTMIATLRNHRELSQCIRCCLDKGRGCVHLKAPAYSLSLYSHPPPSKALPLEAHTLGLGVVGGALCSAPPPPAAGSWGVATYQHSCIPPALPGSPVSTPCRPIGLAQGGRGRGHTRPPGASGPLPLIPRAARGITRPPSDSRGVLLMHHPGLEPTTSWAGVMHGWISGEG